MKRFEERLLDELRRMVAEHPRTERPPRRPRRLVLAGGLASVAAVAAVAGVFLLTGGASPAYAVSKNDDGTVTVEISSLSDAAGLEQKLRDAGIRAVVQYVPPGKACKQPWPTTPGAPPGLGNDHTVLKGGVVHTDDHTRFTISNNLPSDLTLVIVTQTTRDTPGPEAIGITFAHGDVGTCELVDAPAGTPPLGPPPAGAQVHVEHEQAGGQQSLSTGK
jgi:hypothetical protein